MGHPLRTRPITTTDSKPKEANFVAAEEGSRHSIFPAVAIRTVAGRRARRLPPDPRSRHDDDRRVRRHADVHVARADLGRRRRWTIAPNYRAIGDPASELRALERSAQSYTGNNGHYALALGVQGQPESALAALDRLATVRLESDRGCHAADIGDTDGPAL